MKNPILYFIITMAVFTSCAESPHSYVHGEWKARWETDPGSYPDSLTVASYSMDGKWIFNDDQTMSIAAYGFDGCIFGEDTLYHTQNWEVKNDTIFMMTDQKVASLTCKIVEKTDNAIKLQLLPDIFVQLTKE